MRGTRTQHDLALEVVSADVKTISESNLKIHSEGPQQSEITHSSGGTNWAYYSSTNWFLTAGWKKTFQVKYHDCTGSCSSLFALWPPPVRGSVSPSVLHGGGDRVQAVLPCSGIGPRQCVRLSVGERKLLRRPSGHQALGRTVQTEERGRQREVADQVLQSDVQVYRWVQLQITKKK